MTTTSPCPPYPITSSCHCSPSKVTISQPAAGSGTSCGCGMLVGYGASSRPEPSPGEVEDRVVLVVLVAGQQVAGAVDRGDHRALALVQVVRRGDLLQPVGPVPGRGLGERRVEVERVLAGALHEAEPPAAVDPRERGVPAAHVGRQRCRARSARRCTPESRSSALEVCRTWMDPGAKSPHELVSTPASGRRRAPAVRRGRRAPGRRAA